MDSVSLSEILYPEVHLDSPIVTNKLVAILEYARINHNYNLLDPTLVTNIRHRISEGYSNQMIINCIEIGCTINHKLLSYPNTRHVIYPECNESLFRANDKSITRKLRDLFKVGNSIYTKITTKIIDCLNQVNSNLGLGEGLPGTTKNMIQDLGVVMCSSKWFDPFLLWFTLKTEIRLAIKTTTNNMRKRRYRPSFVKGDRYEILVTRDLVTIIDIRKFEVYYLTFEMVLMYCDVIEGRLMTDSAMTIDTKYSGLHVRVTYLWDLIDGFFPVLGNSTYQIVALLEPLSLAYLQLRDATLTLRGAFLHHCFSEIQEILVACAAYTEDTYMALTDSLDSIFITGDIHMTGEIFSFFRSFGHPRLEAITAAENVRKYMNQPKVVSYETLMKGHAIFCGIIINGFRDRHGGTWPPIELPEHASSVIRNAQTSGEGLTHSQCVDNWKTFAGVRFKCFMPLSLDSDLTMYLKDKALAALKKEWDSVYPKEYLRYNPPKSTSSRRLVNVFLEDSEFDPYNMIMYVITGEYLKDNDFNLSYSLKEKEIKEVGRLFAKMTYKMRACQVIAENLISNGIGKFFKDNGMAKDEHDLTKALHTLAVSGVPKDKGESHRGGPPRIPDNYGQQYANRKNPRNNGKGPLGTNSDSFITGSSRSRETDLYETVSAFITTDLKKYCLNWRYETISIFAQRLNEIYGLPSFFQWLHRRLENSVLYVSDPHCPPDLGSHCDLDNVPNDQIFIKYPMGGIEGYCQKLWTISTIPYLYLAAHESGVRIASLVQGDNQTIAVTKRVPSTWPYYLKKSEAARVTTEYFEVLRQRLHDIGHHLKLNETIISSHFFVYSKGIYYDGTLISQSLKSIARCVFWSETIVDETRAACSNISTTLAKSIEKGYDKYLAFSINILKTIQQLLISLGFTINTTMTQDVVCPLLSDHDLLIKMALLPAPIGGFNYLNMSRLFVRNIGDPVTSSLADLKRMINAGILSNEVLHQVMTQAPGDSNFLDWASDPYSANLPCVQSITRLLKNITARHVLINSPNPMLKGLFHDQSSEEDKLLAEFLMDRKVIIPRAAHEILDHTITGAREAIAGMLDTTKGLIRTSMRRGGLTPRIVSKLSTYDYNQFRAGIKLFTSKTRNLLIDQDSCSVQLARALRNHMWASLAKGRPIYGLEVPDILESMRGHLIRRHESCMLCAIGSTHYGWFFVPAGCQLDNITESTSSLRVPYIGSTTEERTDMKLAFVRSPSRSLKSAVRIATVYSWAYGDDDQSWQEAWALARQRANVTLEELRMITPVSTSTNLAHRLRDKSTQVKYSGTSLVRVARYTTISNDNLSFVIADKKVDTNFIYQQGMLLGLGVLEQLFRPSKDTGDSNTVLHLHVETDCCVIPMSDYLRVPSCHKLGDPITKCQNPLIYDQNPIIEKDAVRIYNQSYRRQMVEFVTWSTGQLYHVLAKSTAMSMVELITKFEKDHLNEITALIGDDDINSFITEFLLVDPRLFMVYLGQCVAINWALDIHYHRPGGKYQMGELLFSFISRMSKGVFKILTNALSHSRVYKKFWHSGMIEPVYGPSLDTQNLHSTVYNLIYNCYMTYLDLMLNDELDEFTFILCESDEDLVAERFDNIQARHLAVICDLYCDPKECPQIRGLTPTEKCAVLSEFIRTQARSSPTGLTWNDDPLVVDQFSCSLTYLRRGSIKQIRLRVDPGFVADALDQAQDHNGRPQLSSVKSPLHADFGPPKDELSRLLSSLATISHNLPVTGEYIRNYEVHSFRRLGVNSTACYKAVEIATLIAKDIGPDEQGLFLGEGAGSMLVVYKSILNLSKCYYNSGVTAEARAGQRELAPYPAEVGLVEHQMGVENMALVLFNGRPEVTWVGNVDCYRYILSNIPTGALSLVHSDIETLPNKDHTERLEELCATLSLALVLGREGSTLIIKLMPRVGDWTQGFLLYALPHYLRGYFVYPRYSNYVSTEVYLVLSGLRVGRLINPEAIKHYIMRNGPRSVPGLISHILTQKQSTCIQSVHGAPFDRGEFNPYLRGLTPLEKVLINCGFTINGLKICKNLLNHDISGGEHGLVRSALILYRELLRFNDSQRNQKGMFHAYPVLVDSQIREMIAMIAKKWAGHVILYSEDNSGLTKLVRDLKAGYLIFHLHSNYISRQLSKTEFGILRARIPKNEWLFQLGTKEIKEWFKLLGYGALIQE
ncbi:polymerase [Myotis bat morbillivirus]|uniref:RNA-directed RNA polymerase L n=1 Tax=Myotis bat morbillivirus TaxID=2853286 RepID=A0A8K1LWV7_9MONO|nr:L protein [Cloning vector pEMC-MBaMV-eGFP]UBB97713.1 polymerase [Myotis bat morbillivirus]